MSNKPVTFSNSARTPFKGISLDGVLNAILGQFKDGDRVSPSDIRLNKDGVNAMLGGKLTPVAFATGAAWALAAHANGQKLVIPLNSGKEGGLLAGTMPAAKAAIVQAAHGRSTHGGITAGELRYAVRAAFTTLLTLPISIPKTTVPVAGITEQAESTIEAALVEPAHAPCAINADCGGMDNTAADKIEVAQAAYESHAAMRLAQQAAQAAEQAEKQAAQAAEQAKKQAMIDAGFQRLNSENAQLRALLESVAACRTIKQVKALLSEQGFQLAA